MVKLDEDALICDLAETYQIFDYKRLPLSSVAIFAIGLRDDSRIKLKLSGQKFSQETMILASVHDQLNTLIWFKTKDGQKGINRPPLLTEQLAGIQKQNGVSFDSGKAFEEKRLELLQKITGGGDG